MRKILGLTVLSIAILSKAASANVDEIKVLTTVGDVQAFAAGVSRPVQRGTRLNLNETIITGPQSKVQIYFSDGTTAQIEENTRILLEKYQFKKDKSDELEVSLIDGGIRWLSGETKQNTKLRTTVALTGLRGTYFLSVFRASTQVLGIYYGAGYLGNDGGVATLGSDENYHLAKAISWNIAPEYLLEQTGQYFETFSPLLGGGGEDSADLDRLQNEIGDYFSDIFDRIPDPFRSGPFDDFIDFAYDNYFNSCRRCHGGH